MVGLRALWPVCLGFALFAGCSDLTTPREERVIPLPEPVRPAEKPAAEVASAPAPPPTPPPSPEVAHVLVAYKGAKNAPAKAVRTKDQARKLAEDIAKKAAKEDFAQLAKRMSDDAATSSKGGSLGELSSTSAPKPLYDAASALTPGGVSTVVETEEGFHVLKRPAPPAAPPASAPKLAPKPPVPLPTRPPAPPVRPPPRPRAPGGTHLAASLAPSPGRRSRH
jgi:PPIC-type peptidyl-prolyl cis-trans isomerase-like protein